MNISLKKAERDALSMLLLKATQPDRMVAMGLQFGGPEFQVAMKLSGELKALGSFDPDCDDWGGK